jgi:hypothetical protein
MDPNIPNGNDNFPGNEIRENQAQNQQTNQVSQSFNQGMSKKKFPLKFSSQNLMISGLVAIILILIISTLFIGNKNGIFPKKIIPAATPALAPSVTCAKAYDFNFALRNKDRICILDLSNKGLTSIPKEITEFKRLNKIILSGNKFTTFPEELTLVNSLVEVDLSKNKISDIPVSIANLKNLQKLNLSDNDISTLPEGLPNLTKLSELNFKDNKISVSDQNKIQKALNKTTITF